MSLDEEEENLLFKGIMPVKVEDDFENVFVLVKYIDEKDYVRFFLLGRLLVMEMKLVKTLMMFL